MKPTTKEITVEVTVEVPRKWTGEEALAEIDFILNEFDDTQLRFVGGRWDD